MQKMIPRDAWSVSKNFEPFKRHLFRYLALREGIVMEVYKDQKQIDTVGMGHRVYPGDKLRYGQLVSTDFVLRQFDTDFVTHRSNDFFMSVGKRIPAGIACASFAWTHGPGKFYGSTTHNMIKDLSTVEKNLQDRTLLNWDLHSPVNQERNRADIQLIFPHSLPNGMGYHISQLEGSTFVYVPDLDESFTSLREASASWELKKKIEVPSIILN